MLEFYSPPNKTAFGGLFYGGYRWRDNLNTYGGSARSKRMSTMQG